MQATVLTSGQRSSEPGQVPATEGGTPAPSPGASRWWKIALAVLFAAYFFLVSWDTVKAHFSPDEMFAIWWYWHPPPMHLLVSQFTLWSGALRPVGGLFYLPIYLVFGLNPVPYHVVLLLLLLAGAYLMYRFARALGCAEMPAAMVALIACYHGGLGNLYYNSVFVFDVLCGIFYFGALAYYARIRSSGRLLSWGQTAAFLGLYLCALNSKEMAVTLPVILLAYECLLQPPPRLPWKNLVKWLLGPGRILCLTGLMNLLFIYGRSFGPDGLMNGPSTAYKPVLSLGRIVDFQERYIGDIFYHLPRFGWLATLLTWLAVTWLVWRRRRPLLRFCWVYVLVTPLPVEFLIGRDQACLYVCLAGWAVLAATLFTDLVTSAAPRVAAAEPALRRLELGRVRTLLAAAGMMIFALGNWSFKQTDVAAAMPALGPQTFEVLAEFQKMNPSVPPGCTVVFLDDPWPNAGFDMAFIAELWFRDRKTRVLLNQVSHLPPEEIAKAGAVFTWQNGKLIRVR
jgi:hypothetical protein